MKATKKVIGELEKCYSLAMLHYQGKDHFLCMLKRSTTATLSALMARLKKPFGKAPAAL